MPPSLDPTPQDPAPGGLGPPGGQDVMVQISEKDLAALKQKAAGYDGYYKQQHDKVKADFDRLTPEAETLRTTVANLTQTVTGLQGKVTELEPFRAKSDDLARTFGDLQGKHEKLSKMASHPALMANPALRALIESSTLAGEALDQQIALLAQGLAAPAAPAPPAPPPGQPTPPLPPAAPQRTAQAAWDEANALPLGSPKWREAMNEYYRMADAENPYLPPEETTSGDFPGKKE